MRTLWLILSAATLFIFVGLGLIFLSTPSEDKVTVYFYRYDKLYPVKRSLNSIKAPEEVAALGALFRGPTTEEKSNRMQTMVPPNLRPTGIEREENSVLLLVFDDDLLKISGGSNVINGALKQIVFTATEINGIKAVRFQVNSQGSETPVIGGEGYTIDRPLDRAYFKGVN